MNAESFDMKAVGPRIRMMMPLLTPLEAKVVDTVFAMRDFSDETSLKQIAENAKRFRSHGGQDHQEARLLRFP